MSELIKTNKFKIYQGQNTPLILFYSAEYDFDPVSATIVLFANDVEYTSDNRVYRHIYKQWKLEDIQIQNIAATTTTEAYTKIILPMTQKDTLHMEEGNVRLEVKWLDDENYIHLHPIISGEIIGRWNKLELRNVSGNITT